MTFTPETVSSSRPFPLLPGNSAHWKKMGEKGKKTEGMKKEISTHSYEINPLARSHLGAAQPDGRTNCVLLSSCGLVGGIS